MKKLKSVMLAGTGSDVGKSVIAAGLCRIFKQDGYCPAPFKAQNMALNSFVTPDGLELGRAQAVQAEAAGIECEADMNPILLKPSGDMTSQVVILGRPAGNKSARDYFRQDAIDDLREVACNAYDRLNHRFNPIVMEGAGSISELNLRNRDIVNMPMARHADAAVILVADIDRGGVFASVYGSVMLQNETDRQRIKGIIINKFRGDMALFEDGRKMIEELCGIPVVGVVPFNREIFIEEEDSVSLLKKNTLHSEQRLVNVAVVAIPHMSNFTDFYTLALDSRIHLYFTSSPEEILAADVVILPGSKNTISSLRNIKNNGCAEAVVHAATMGKTVVGICGGYQMLGAIVNDSHGIEGVGAIEQGLGLLPVHTTLTANKITRRREFITYDNCARGRGYEVHQGISVIDAPAKPMMTLLAGEGDGGECDGAVAESGNVFGTYLHGFLDSTEVIDWLFRRHFSAKGLAEKSETMSYTDFKDTQFDLLAKMLRESLDMDLIYKIMSHDD